MKITLESTVICKLVMRFTFQLNSAKYAALQSTNGFDKNIPMWWNGLIEVQA